MDVFAHVLWTNVVFYKKYRTEKWQRIVAMAFGVLPDLVVFTPAFFYMIFSGKRFGIESFNSGAWVFRYAAEGYNYTHSIVIFAAAMVIVTLIRGGKVYPHTNKADKLGLVDKESLSGGNKIKAWVKGIGVGVYWPMWGWALHIGIDIFTHKGFYETPFLFPLSNYKFEHGITWAHPVFMLINYSSLALVYLFWFFVLRKKYAQKPTI